MEADPLHGEEDGDKHGGHDEGAQDVEERVALVGFEELLHGLGGGDLCFLGGVGVLEDFSVVLDVVADSSQLRGVSDEPEVQRQDGQAEQDGGDGDRGPPRESGHGVDRVQEILDHVDVRPLARDVASGEKLVLDSERRRDFKVIVGGAGSCRGGGGGGGGDLSFDHRGRHGGRCCEQVCRFRSGSRLYGIRRREKSLVALNKEGIVF